jgi:hypothetical protein
MPGAVGGRPGLRLLLMSYLLAASLRCQASSVAGVTGKISAQRLRGMSRASAASHTRSAGPVSDPAGVAAQHRVLMPEHQQLGLLRLVPADCQDSQAEYPANQQVDDLEQHQASQPLPRPDCWRRHRSAAQSIIRAAQGLSWRKVATVLDLAQRFSDGRLSEAELRELPDQEVIRRLTEVKGIGAWTVQGALLIALQRPDVIRPDDLALRHAIQARYGLDHLPDPAEVADLAQHWRPYRSLASSLLLTAAKPG